MIWGFYLFRILTNLGMLFNLYFYLRFFNNLRFLVIYDFK